MKSKLYSNVLNVAGGINELTQIGTIKANEIETEYEVAPHERSSSPRKRCVAYFYYLDFK
jgi:hypothetical protein